MWFNFEGYTVELKHTQTMYPKVCPKREDIQRHRMPTSWKLPSAIESHVEWTSQTISSCWIDTTESMICWTPNEETDNFTQYQCKCSLLSVWHFVFCAFGLFLKDGANLASWWKVKSLILCVKQTHSFSCRALILGQTKMFHGWRLL